MSFQQDAEQIVAALAAVARVATVCKEFHSVVAAHLYTFDTSNSSNPLLPPTLLRTATCIVRVHESSHVHADLLKRFEPAVTRGVLVLLTVGRVVLTLDAPAVQMLVCVGSRRYSRSEVQLRFCEIPHVPSLRHGGFMRCTLIPGVESDTEGVRGLVHRLGLHLRLQLDVNHCFWNLTHVEAAVHWNPWFSLTPEPVFPSLQVLKSTYVLIDSRHMPQLREVRGKLWGVGELEYRGLEVHLICTCHEKRVHVVVDLLEEDRPLHELIEALAAVTTNPRCRARLCCGHRGIWSERCATFAGGAACKRPWLSLSL